MIDFTGAKAITIPEGPVKRITRKRDGEILWEKIAYKNWVPLSTTEDGKTIYNGGLGYKNGYRVRSGGGEGTQARGTCTGFIPVNSGDVVRISGCDFLTASNGNAINSADSSFTNIGQFTMLPAGYGIYLSYGNPTYYYDYGPSSVVEESDGIWKWVVPPAGSGVSYIRISGYNNTGKEPGSNLIVTVNEKIA